MLYLCNIYSEHSLTKVRDYASRCHVSRLNTIPLFGKGLSASCSSLTRLVRDTSGVLLPTVIGGGALFYCQFQSNASTSPVGDTELSPSADFLLAFVLVTFFLCDSTCRTAIGFFTEALIAPFWHRVRDRYPTSSARSVGRSRSLKEWLCSPSRNQKDTRPCRSMQVSQNRAPPHLPLLSAYSHI